MKGIHYVVVGAIVCLISAFTPILSFPILGDANLLSIMPELAYGLIGLSVLALILASTEAHRFAFFPGIGNGLVALAVLIYFFDFQHRISALADRGAEEGGFVGNLVSGLSEAASIATTLLWGWPVLLVGAGLIVFGANKASEEHLNFLAEADDVDEIINEILERDAESAEYGYHSEDGRFDDADEGYQTYRPSKVPLVVFSAAGSAALILGVWWFNPNWFSDEPDYVVTASELNCRIAPTTDSKAIATFAKGKRVNALDFQDDWIKVAHEGTSCWASADYLTAVSAERVDGGAAEPTSDRFVELRVPTPIMRYQCHMGACTWGQIRKVSNQRNFGSAIFRRVDSRVTNTETSPDEEYPTRFPEWQNAQWRLETDYAYCSLENPATVSWIQDEGQYVVTPLSVVETPGYQISDVRMYRAVCHGDLSETAKDDRWRALGYRANTQPQRWTNTLDQAIASLRGSGS